MNELFTVGITLSSHDVDDDGNNDVVGDVLGVLDDGIDDKEEDSDIFEAVAGKEESNTGGFNNVSEDGFNFVLNSA